MTENTWRPIYGIKFRDELDEAVKPGPASLVDAIPARNGIWDSRNTQGLDKVALHGFTTDELVELGALAANINDEKCVLANNLKGPVHPAFAIDRWETELPAHFSRKHFFALGFDGGGYSRPGDYVANNKIVWAALLPSLLLASKFVENAHKFLWFSAILHSDIHSMPNLSPETERLNPPLRKVPLRPEQDLASPVMERATRKRIAAIIKNLNLGISDGKADPTGKSPRLRVNYDGLSMAPWEGDGKTYRIYIAYQIVARLLEEDISPSTKLALQFHLTVTLLHEFAHILVFAKDGARDVKLYLDNERMSEAGFSFEMNTFGGHPVLVLDHTDTPGYAGLRAGFFLEDWLGTAKGQHLTVPLTGTDKDWNNEDWREARSIPLSFLQELGQEDFWRCFVSRWGAEALRVYPWTEGRLVKRVGDALQTQIYSPQPQFREWLESTLSFISYPIRLSTDELIAHQIANRRISRDREIKSLVESRRELEGGRQGETTNSSPSSPEAINFQEKKPWEERADNIEHQKAIVLSEANNCAEEVQHVRDFLKRKDVRSSEYFQIQDSLRQNNFKQCRSIRNKISCALNDDILSQLEEVLERYETMKDKLGRVSRESSADREFEKTQHDARRECKYLLRKAKDCRSAGENDKCSKYCAEVLAKGDASNYQHASAYLLDGLCIEDPQMKLWLLTESVRLFKFSRHLEGTKPKENTKLMTERSEQVLKDTVEKFGPTVVASIQIKKSSASTVPGIVVDSPSNITPKPGSPQPAPFQPGLRSSPPETTLGQLGIIPSNVTPPKKTHQPFSGFGNPPGSTSFELPLSGEAAGAPKDMSSIEVMRHRRTFKVINQARRNFFNGEYALAEKGYLNLLELESTTDWQKARCNVFLASIPWRSDRSKRAKMALKMYRDILRDDPDDERRVVAVDEAEVMLKNVLKELEEVISSELEPGERKDGSRVKFGGNTTIPIPGRTDLQTISKGKQTECGDRDQSKLKNEKEMGNKQKSVPGGNKGQVTPRSKGIFNKVTSFLGLKRRRKDNDDGEEERVNRDKRVQHAA